MVQLILIRHGVTDWNEQKKYIGSTDLSLSKKGIAQANALSKALKNEPLTAIYSSKFIRALHTAEIIRESHNLEINILPGLNEIDFGKWEGLTFNQIDEDWPNFIERWLTGEGGLPPQGEPTAVFKERVKDALNKIITQNYNGTVVVVAHAGTIKFIICHLLGLDFSEMWRMRLDSGAISKIDLYDNGKNVLTLLNDTCHLNGV
jgi:alpha-ribazole phosphatase